MKKKVGFFVFCSILLVGCTYRQPDHAAGFHVDTMETHCKAGYKGELIPDFNGDTISFFGGTLVIDDSADVMLQIKEIAAKDKMLSVEGRVLTVGEVGFGINVHGNGVILISGVQIDDPKIKPVVQYLKSLYGNPTDAVPESGYYWFDNDIRLRQLHSEDGGTTIIFQGINGVEKSNNE